MDIFILIFCATCVLTLIWLDYKFGHITISDLMAWFKKSRKK